MPVHGKKRHSKRLSRLETDRSSWDPHWRDIQDHVKPRRHRFMRTDRNRGTKKHDKIINNVATRSQRILVSGMQASITSPARPWFRMVTTDQGLMEFQSVRQWLKDVADRMLLVCARSNIYNAFPLVYQDISGPGTACMFVDEDADDVIRAYVYAIGSYYLATDDRLLVRTMYRKGSMTVDQLVKKFAELTDDGRAQNITGSSHGCSVHVLDQYNHGNLDTWIDIVHVFEVNDTPDLHRDDFAGMPYRAVWYEEKSDSGNDDKLLGVSGYNEWPLMTPRWEVTDEDVYGSDSPGMIGLGDVKALQHYEKRGAEVMDKIVRPPMNAPASLRRKKASLLPGDVNYHTVQAGGQKFEPAIKIEPRALQVEAKIDNHERRIGATWMADLFLMISSLAGGNRTAREIEERHTEKMLQLGPTLERVIKELLDPFIDRLFGIMLRKDLLPPIPRELEGVDLRVEYISVLAAAQKQLGTVNIERLVSFGKALYEADPEGMFDKLDREQVMDEYGELMGTSPDLLRSTQEANNIRGQRQQAAQDAQEQAMQAKAAKDAAGAAQALGNTPTAGGGSALDQMLGGGQAPPGQRAA